MTAAEMYRVKAAQFAEWAMHADTPEKQAEFASMAAAYLRLSKQAEQNAETDIVYETPDRSAGETAP